ncbi:hypothetical protein [Yoonia sp. SS1-5]|uniref:Uncharacterized protein n=1 Tax=Yoonia rhodophyticola TaxID=3137370 RepID=A0AAN0MG32_9RHOB
MLGPFDIWSPIIRAPFSGDVTQEITPRVFSPEIKGNARIEHRIQTEVASYGAQLGKVLEALQVLAAQSGTALPDIDALVADVEAVKHDARDALREEAETALARLKSADPDGWAEVIRQ